MTHQPSDGLEQYLHLLAVKPAPQGSAALFKGAPPTISHCRLHALSASLQTGKTVPVIQGITGNSTQEPFLKLSTDNVIRFSH